LAARGAALVVLNGASSAGKTSIAQALASRLGPGCVLTGLDEILERVRPLGREGSAGRGLRVLWFQLSDGRLRLFRRLHREAAAFARGGRDVIVESALMDRRALLDAAACFAPLGGLFVGVKPPLAVSEHWEAARADRPTGQARKHYALIHAHGHYDLLLDPSVLTPAECASAILRRLAGPRPEAFQKIFDSQL
jgi:chloramphenicol 3-O phosphotransferase